MVGTVGMLIDWAMGGTANLVIDWGIHLIGEEMLASAGMEGKLFPVQWQWERLHFEENACLGLSFHR